jgi:hypothetical protein
MKYLLFLFLCFGIALPAEADFSLLPTDKSVLSEDERSLAQKIQEGVSLEVYDIPVYIRFLTEQLVRFSWIIAVGVVIYGGYKYILGGLSGEDGGGKDILKRVFLYGLPLIILSWIILDIILRLVLG